jgi:CO/xanthine dehydrogenase FAD-binding subunit
MLNKLTTVYFASSISDVQTMFKNVAGISLVAGGTEISRRQTGRSLHLPANVLALSHVDELRAVSKTERYLDLGSCVTLADTLSLGKKNVPEVLHEALRTIANPGVRALATIGGNISAKGQRLSAFAPLLALDARLEVRTALEATWIPMSRYFSNIGREAKGEPEFISRIRIPTEEWDLSIYRRIGRTGVVTDTMASFAFLVKSQKNILSDIRVAYAGKFFFRRREFENLMIGRSLPLSEKDILVLMDKAELFFDKTLFPPSYERACLFNMLEDSLQNLT